MDRATEERGLWGMRKFDCFWMSDPRWYERKENGVPVIKPDAPLGAQESYRHYQERRERAAKDADNYMD